MTETMDYYKLLWEKFKEEHSGFYGSDYEGESATEAMNEFEKEFKNRINIDYPKRINNLIEEYNKQIDQTYKASDVANQSINLQETPETFMRMRCYLNFVGKLEELLKP
jgi:hypothetical protein